MDLKKQKLVEAHDVSPALMPSFRDRSDASLFGGRVVVSAEAERSYIARKFSPFFAAIQALPSAFDDISCQFGIDVYEKMSQDAEVSASIDLLSLASCSAQGRFVPAVLPTHPKFKKARLIADFFEEMFDGLKTSFIDTRKALVDDGLKFGASVAEMEFDVTGKKIRVVDIRPKDVRNIAFVVDNFNSTVGLIPRNSFSVSTLPYNTYVPVSGNQKLDGIIPRSKFLVMSWNPKDGDPRGRSALRPAYTAWWIKQQLINEMLSWYSKFAQPSIWATTAPDAAPTCYTDVNGNQVTVNPADTMLDALTQFKNASVMVVPHGATVNTINLSASGEIFLKGIDWANREIVRAITKQHLASADGEHQSRAASEVHQDVLSLYIIHIKNWQSEAIRRDVILPLTIANFGDSSAELAPHIDFGDGDGFPFSVSEIAMLKNAEWFDPSQYAFVDKMLGLPIRTVQIQEQNDNRNDESNSIENSSGSSDGSEGLSSSNDVNGTGENLVSGNSERGSESLDSTKKIQQRIQPNSESQRRTKRKPRFGQPGVSIGS